MIRACLYALIGYLSGSLLFARYSGILLGKKRITDQSDDGNPGTFNAFAHGGFWCGVFTLIGDCLKGFLPVWCYFHADAPSDTLAVALVLAAPVVGHLYPVFHRFRGGKGVAVTFGVLLGLLPRIAPVLVLAIVFILTSTVIRISPHYHRTWITYIVTALILLFVVRDGAIRLGFVLITVVIVGKLMKSREREKKLKVNVVWRS